MGLMRCIVGGQIPKRPYDEKLPLPRSDVATAPPSPPVPTLDALLASRDVDRVNPPADWATRFSACVVNPKLPPGPDNPYRPAPLTAILKKTYQAWHWKWADRAAKLCREEMFEAEPGGVPDGSITARLTKALLKRNIEIKANPGDVSINLITAILRQVSGIYTRDDLPPVQRALLDHEADLHRMEAQALLKEVNAAPGAETCNEPIGLTRNDARLPILLNKISERYNEPSLNLLILAPLENSEKMREIGEYRGGPAPTVDRQTSTIAIIKENECFKPLTSTRPISNPVLTREFYVAKKNPWTQAVGYAGHHLNFKRKQVRNMSDGELEAKIRSLEIDPCGKVVNKKCVYRKELEKRLAPPLKKTGTLMSAFKEREIWPLPKKNPYLKYSDENLRTSYNEILAALPTNAQIQLSKKEQCLVVEAYNARAIENRNFPRNVTELDALHMTRAQLKKWAKRENKMHEHDELVAQVLATDPSRLVPGPPLVSPVCDIPSIKLIKAKFEKYLADHGRVEGPNGLIKSVNPEVEKAQLLFFEAVSDGDQTKLAAATEKLEQVLLALGGVPASTPGTEAALPDRPSASCASTLSFPELKQFQRIHLIDFGLSDHQVDEVFAFEEHLEKNLKNNQRLRSFVGDPANQAFAENPLTWKQKNKKLPGEIAKLIDEKEKELVRSESMLRNLELQLKDPSRAADLAPAIAAAQAGPLVSTQDPVARARELQEQIQAKSGLIARLKNEIAAEKWKKECVELALHVDANTREALHEKLDHDLKTTLSCQDNIKTLKRLSHRENHLSVSDTNKFITTRDALREDWPPLSHSDD